MPALSRVLAPLPAPRGRHLLGEDSREGRAGASSALLRHSLTRQAFSASPFGSSPPARPPGARAWPGGGVPDAKSHGASAGDGLMGPWDTHSSEPKRNALSGLERHGGRWRARSRVEGRRPRGPNRPSGKRQLRRRGQRPGGRSGSEAAPSGSVAARTCHHALTVSSPVSSRVARRNPRGATDLAGHEALLSAPRRQRRFLSGAGCGRLCAWGQGSRQQPPHLPLDFVVNPKLREQIKVFRSKPKPRGRPSLAPCRGSETHTPPGEAALGSASPPP